MQWGVAYYEAPDGTVPAADFLDSCPTKVDANFAAVLEAVRAAPPPAFSGGGKWEAMHGRMAGYYEIRGTGPGRMHYRLFCRLENGTPDELKALGFDRPDRRHQRHGQEDRRAVHRRRIHEARPSPRRRLPQPHPRPVAA